jgi:hypothetical protein
MSRAFVLLSRGLFFYLSKESLDRVAVSLDKLNREKLMLLK